MSQTKYFMLNKIIKIHSEIKFGNLLNGITFQTLIHLLGIAIEIEMKSFVEF